MKVIGILGGSSDQSTADYYRLLNRTVRERLGGWNTAELLVNSLNFAKSERWVRQGLWDEAGADLAARARGLEAAGAELLICCSNTLHRVAEVFTRGLGIPFLHIVDPTAAAIRQAGLRRVALLGTKPVMSTDFLRRRYTERFGVEILVPESGEQDMVDRVIFDELCKGDFTPASKAAYLALIDRLQERGAEGAILGCTEIPLLVKQTDRPAFPLFDTTALHVAEAIRLSLGG